MSIHTPHRIIAGAFAAAAVATAVLVGASPASADPPYAKPDLDVVSCYVQDDPVDYHDGIDWWKLTYTYRNDGYLATGKSFTVRSNFVWQPGVGNEVSLDQQHPAMAHGETASATFWVTSHVVDQRTWGVFLDTGFAISEFNENDNFCTAWANPS